jgi:hypothetical protein
VTNGNQNQTTGIILDLWNNPGACSMKPSEWWQFVASGNVLEKDTAGKMHRWR